MFSLNVFFQFDCRRGIPERFISEIKTRQRGSRTHSDTEPTHEGVLLVVFVVSCVNLVVVFSSSVIASLPMKVIVVVVRLDVLVGIVDVVVLVVDYGDGDDEMGSRTIDRWIS